MHQINFAIVSEPAILKDQLSFAVSRLFEGQMAWAVPASLSEVDLRLALNAPPDGKGVNPILTNYIEIEASVSTRAASDEWYRAFLPAATATFTTPTLCRVHRDGGRGPWHLPRPVFLVAEP